MSESAEPTAQEEKAILDGERIKAFVTDPVVEKAVLNLNKLYWERVKSAKTVAERELSAANGRVLDDLLMDLQKVVNAGHIAKVTVERRQRTPRK